MLGKPDRTVAPTRQKTTHTVSARYAYKTTKHKFACCKRHILRGAAAVGCFALPPPTHHHVLGEMQSLRRPTAVVAILQRRQGGPLWACIILLWNQRFKPNAGPQRIPYATSYLTAPQTRFEREKRALAISTCRHKHSPKEGGPVQAYHTFPWNENTKKIPLGEMILGSSRPSIKTRQNHEASAFRLTAASANLRSLMLSLCSSPYNSPHSRAA